MSRFRFRRSHTAGWLTFLFTVAGTSTIAAQPESPPMYADSVPTEGGPLPTAAPSTPAETPLVQLGFALGLTYESEQNSNVVVAAPVLQGRLTPTRAVQVDLDWGLASLIDGQGTTVRTGNPWVQGRYHAQLGSARWAAGVGVTAPIARVALGMDGRLQRQLYNEAFAIWGAWDMWRWTPGRVATPLVVDFATPLGGSIDLEARAAIAPLFGASEGESGTEVVGQAAAALCAITPHARVCPRLQGVVLPSTSLDRLQLAGGLRVILDWGHLFADVLVNLDEPLGVAGRGTRHWGLQIGKGFDR